MIAAIITAVSIVLHMAAVVLATGVGHQGAKGDTAGVKAGTVLVIFLFVAAIVTQVVALIGAAQ